MFPFKAKLIEVVQKPYSVNGNEGISYKLRFLLENDEIVEIKSTKEQTESLKPLLKKSGTANLNLSVRKEVATLVLASFDVK